MKPIRRLAFALLLLGPAARADVVHLHNGRTIEGEVVEHTTERVAIKLPAGKISFPTSQVERVERRRTAQQEFGERARRTDMTDPDAIDGLALWASARGLGEEAQALQVMASGLRLEERIEEVRGSQRGRDYVEVFHWARAEGCSDEVQDWLIGQARQFSPDDPQVLEAARIRADDLSERAAQAARRDELKNRPRFRLVSQEDEDVKGGVIDGLVRKQRDERARVAELEAELERQREKISSLEDEVAQKRRPIRRRRAGRQTGQIMALPPEVQLLPVPDCGPIPGAPEPAPLPAPAPAPRRAAGVTSR